MTLFNNYVVLQNLVKGGCKLSSFSAKINPRAAKEFLKLCFGVVVLDDPHPNCHSKEYQFLHEPITVRYFLILFNKNWKK